MFNRRRILTGLAAVAAPAAVSPAARSAESSPQVVPGDRMALESQLRAPGSFLRVPANADSNAIPSFGPATSGDLRHLPDIPPSLATPQVLRQVLNDVDHYRLSQIWDHDRTPMENTARLQELVDWLSINRKQLWVDRGNGRPYLITPATPSWKEFGPAALPAQRAVTIRQDHFHIVGNGGRIVMVAPPGGQEPHGKCYAFSTEQNMQIGTIKDVTVEGNPYDWDSTISYVSGGLTSNYMLGLCGVRGINIRDVLALNSSRSRRGHFSAIYNSADLRVTNFELQYMQQGFNLNYVEDILFRGLRARVFGEVIDANFPIYRAIFEDLDADNSGMARGESQLLDLVGKDIRVTGVRVRNQASNAIAVYGKGKSWPDYARHVAMNGAVNPNPIGTENVIIENVHAEDAGLQAGYPLVMLGNRRRGNLEGIGGVVDGVTYQPMPVPRNLTLRHLRGRRTSGVAVQEGRDVRVEDVILEDCYGGVHSNYHAFRAGQQTDGRNVRNVSHFSGVIRDIQVRGARYGGILIDGPGEVTTENLFCEGWGSAREPAPGGVPTAGFWVANVNLKAGLFRFRGYSALDTLEIGGRPSLQFTGSGVGSEATSKPIDDGGGHRITGTTPLLLEAAADTLKQFASVHATRLGRQDLASQARIAAAAGVAATRDISLRRQGVGRKALIVNIELDGSVRSQSDGTLNLAIRKFRRDGTDVTLATFSVVEAMAGVGRVTSQPLSMRPNKEEDALVSEGEQLVLTMTRRGSGGDAISIPDVTVLLSLQEWLSN